MQRRTFLLATLASACLKARPPTPSLGALAYVQPDGLWLRDLPDGQPRRVTAGTKIHSPRFSPSGSWIVYTLDEAAHVASIDGRQIVPLDGLRAQWTPDRDHLLVEQSPGLSLFTPANAWSAPLWSIPGAELPAIFLPPDPASTGPTSTPAMVYADETDIAGTRTGRLCRVTIAQPTDRPRILAAESDNGIIPCRWLPGPQTRGQLLYWVDDDFSGSAASDGLNLYRIPADASSAVPRPLGIATLLNEDFLSLSPKTNLLAAAAGMGRDACENKRIAIIDPSTWQVRYLTGDETTAVTPAWSPDGTLIAYSAAPSVPNGCGGGERMRDALAKRRICALSPTGSPAPIALTSDDRYRDEKPQWSADGRRILFCRIDHARNQTVWLMRADGTAPVQVAGPLDPDNAEDPDLAWFGYYGTIDWRARLDWRR